MPRHQDFSALNPIQIDLSSNVQGFHQLLAKRSCKLNIFNQIEIKLMQPSTRTLEDYQQERMKFSSPITFMLTALGFAAGFGSVWRFPYLVFKNGGGTFLIPYFILLFTLAIPLFYLEIGIGQLKGIGLAHLLQLEKPRLRGFGYVGIIICVFISTYYNLIMSYSLDFLANSFSNPLPWATGDKLFNKSYFYNDMIHMSSDISQMSNKILITIAHIVWPLYICYVISLVLVYFCIKEGVETSGKVAIVTATAPYVLLIILLVKGLTLDGASTGLYYLFRPNFLKLFDPFVWVDAANQVIFQMSVGQAVLVLFGSYRQKQDNIAKFSIGIPTLTAFCGLLAGSVVFSYIGFVSHETGRPIESLPLSGPDLAFVLYPAILAGMPWANVWCVLFFSCMLLLGIDTQFGFIEAIAGTIEDAYYGEFKIFGYQLSIQQTRLLVCVLNGVAGLLYASDIGFHLLGFVDTFATNISFMLIVLFQIWYFCWGERFIILQNEIKANANEMPEFIRFSLGKICHFSVAILLGFSVISQIKNSFDYPFWISGIGWFISFLPFIVALNIYRTTPEEKPVINEQELKFLD